MSTDLPVALVLGAGMGGRAVARALAGRSHVVVVDREPSAAQRAVDGVTGAGGIAEPASVDLTDLTEVQGFRDRLVERLGRVDAVIHLVGGWRGSQSVDEEALSNWAALEPGILGTVRTTSVAFREQLAQAPAGRYVMVSSTSVDRPTAGNVAYASIKAAAETWVRGLAAAFRDTPARACIMAVMALVDDDTRAANPDKTFKGYTDTKDLAAAIAAALRDEHLENGSRTIVTSEHR